jgi:hypothetical protein
VFIDSVNICCDNAMETPTNCQQVNVHDMMDVFIGGNTSGNGTSLISHIINGLGDTVGPSFATAYSDCLWPHPAFGLQPAVSGSNITFTFPTESWHSVQLQYKNRLADPNWSNLNAPVGGNDALQTLGDATGSSNRFYRIESF